MAQYVADCYQEGCGFVTIPTDDPRAASDELAQHLHATGHSHGSEPHEME